MPHKSSLSPSLLNGTRLGTLCTVHGDLVGVEVETQAGRHHRSKLTDHGSQIADRQSSAVDLNLCEMWRLTLRCSRSALVSALSYE